MNDARRAAAIVPVRLDSQRLPRKAMLAESGTPLFLHTWQRAVEASAFDRVVVATDSDEIEVAARDAGADVVRTSAGCRTGSERCAEAAGELGPAYGFFVNIQGDWPEVAPADLDALVTCLRSGSAPTATLAVPLTEPERIADPNVVKVVRGLDARALYFSRATIPFVRGAHGVTHLRHIGVYAFDRETLLQLPELPSSGLAETESLEQLRLLENGIPMHVLDATGCPWGIESRPDYDAFLERLHHSNRS
ncbi:MAG: 3-deoxy-manno-octulosonate cytidylyltransferase [Planctomycetes bacterium]|nr:3-deoxy-manno-octulosonate cytidylyltransferase [Planctomycetota bacterium]